MDVCEFYIKKGGRKTEKKGDRIEERRKVVRNVYTGLEQTKYANRAAVQMFSSECNADMELELQTHQYTARTCRSLKEIKFRFHFS